MTTTLDAIIFDFDGTLAELTIDFDALKNKLAALAEVFMGERPDPGGKPALEWLDDLARDVEEWEGRDMALELHSRGRLTINAHELDAARTGRLFPFTMGLLDELRGAGVATGIITRNSTAAVKVVFPDIEQHCGVFLAREDVPGVKPDPAHLLAALERIGVAPRHALMVGDHSMDIETGVRAGCRTAGVASGIQDLHTLGKAGANFLTADAQALLDELKRHGLVNGSSG